MPSAKKEARPFLHFFLLLVLAPLLLLCPRGARGAPTEALLCNGQTALGKALTVRAWGLHPETQSYECSDAGMRNELAQYIGERVACFVAGFEVGPIGFIAGPVCAAELDNVHNAHLARCDTERARLADQAAGLNARIQAADAPFLFGDTIPSEVHVDWVLTPSTTATAFLPTVDGAGTLWTGMGFTGTRGCTSSLSAAASPAATCNNNGSWIFEPPDALTGGGLLGVGATSFVPAGGATLDPDLVFDAQLQLSAASPDGRLMRTTRPGSRDVAWAFRMDGCALPNATLRVSWAPAVETVQGQSAPTPYLVDATGRTPPRVTCWQRTLTVRSVVPTGIADPATALLCRQPMELNDLRALLLAVGSRDAARAKLVAAAWASSADGRSLTVNYPPAYADAMLACAQPLDGIGGVWGGLTAGSVGVAQGTPGLCAPCASVDAQALRRANQRVRACNRSLTAESLRDCCHECLPGYVSLLLTPQALDACAPWCRPGTALVASGASCASCPAGTYSAGGLGACATCAALGVPNAYASAHQGCVSCGVGAYAAAGACVPCPAGQFVPPGLAACQGCDRLGWYYTAGATACAPCPPGTYMDALLFAAALSGDGAGASSRCQLCGANAIAPAGGSTACVACGAGQRHNANHTACVACGALNASRLPFAQYYASGCAVRCAPAVSYLLTNALAPGGCGNCSLLVAPPGRFASSADCRQTVACTNAPAHAVYTGPSLTRGVSACPFACAVGYYYSSSSPPGCAACAYPAGYSAPALHRPTTGCQYTCSQPGVYIDALSQPACRTRCVDLLADFRSGVGLAARVRDYTSNASSRPRPNYVQGVCSNDTRASLGSSGGLLMPVLARGRWAWVSPTRPAGACGDAFLNVGEACDDGNTVSGDGCSAACAVETDRAYWDCDLIGAPCLPQCGWPAVAASWDLTLATLGYVLPAAPVGGVYRCDAGLTYYDVKQRPDRMAWIASRFVPCDCGGNAFRVVPYANCTAANRGCRMCPSGQYHDDLRGACAACGSACAPGFFSAAAPSPTICGPSVETSRLNATALGVAGVQAAIGCAACVPPAGGAAGIRYVAGCAYACWRDPAGAAATDTYCTGAPDAATGVCGGLFFCRSCALGLSLLLQGPPPPAGYYPLGCVDGAGYQWAACDAEARPANAVWTGYTTVANAARGCPFACAPNTLAWNGGCLPCFAYASGANAPCRAGQTVQYCGASHTTAACVPCSGPLAGMLQAWTSDAPYFTTCYADCEPGVSFASSAAQSGAKCTACTRMACALGQMLVACTPRADATCVACAAAGQPLRANAEYVAPGACAQRCVAGYFQDPQGAACLPCVPLAACALGAYPSSQCATPPERLARPVCLPCASAMMAGRRWVQDTCTQVCLAGTVERADGSCAPCNPGALCALGERGVCSTDPLSGVTRLACSPCPAPPSGTVYVSPGDCGPTACVDGLVRGGGVACVAPPTTAVATPAPAGGGKVRMGGLLAPGVAYPTRTLPHS